MNVLIKHLSHIDLDEFTQLISVFEDVFEIENFTVPPADRLRHTLAREEFIVLVGMHNEKVVAGLTAYTLPQYYTVSPLVYIFDLAVKPAYQRQGIGKRLIDELQAYCKSIGVEEVFVQADSADGHALDFYRSIGGVATDVVHFSYSLNKGD